MRSRRADLRKRINAQLALRFCCSGLTCYSGLELIRRYFNRLDLRRQIKDILTHRLPATDFGAVPMTLLVLALVIVGGRRVRHIGYLQSDPMVRRFCGLEQVPVDRTVARWLASFDAYGVDGLLKLNEGLSADIIRRQGLKRLTLDIDGSVVSTGLKVEGARRGFNPHHRKVPSYYPITAYEAQSGLILRAENRPGNVHDGKASVSFIEALIDQLRCDLPAADVLEFRLDSAFFLKDVLDVLDTGQVEYAVKVPFWRALGLQDAIAGRSLWHRVNDDVGYFEHQLTMKRWQHELRVVVYRKRVFHETRKNFQLDLFDPDDGYYEYSAIATNKHLGGSALWHFMCGRGAHEKAYAELKTGFAFDSIPSQSYWGNCAWQLFSVLAFNLTRGLQSTVSNPVRQRSAKRSTWFRLSSIQTLRFEWINRAGLMVSPNGQQTLDVGTSLSVRANFERIDHALQSAA